METAPLPTGSAFERSFRLLEAALSVPAVAVLVFYLQGVLDLGLDEWKVFALAVTVAAAVFAIGSEPLRRRWTQPIRTYLDLRPDARTPEATRAAFAAVAALPRWMLRYQLVSWTNAGVGCAIGMGLFGPRTFGVFECAVLVFAGVSGGLVAGTLIFFSLRHQTRAVREALAAQLPDPRERARLVGSMPLRTKLVVTVAGSAVASISFALLVSYAKASESVAAFVGAWHSRTLAAVAEGLPGAPADAPLAEVARLGSVLPAPVTLARLDTDERHAPPGLLSNETADKIRREVAAGATAGSLRPGGALVTWRAVAGGAVLVAETPAIGLHADVGHMALMFGALMVLAVGVAAAAVALFARDIEGATRALSDAARRMAQGDLSRGQVFESEDEFGQLARAFEETSESLRGLVGEVASAAERVDAAAGDLAGVSAAVAASAKEQTREMREASQAMEEIHRQVGGLAHSAEQLNISVEEAGSSILELGAAGEELKDTAGVLSSKVDEVSTSIEQMLRTTRQVADHSEALVEAASDTSASMEEMASAMRAVDVTAATTTRLTAEVAASADSGHARVRETMQGMDAIQDATEAAERVIRGLGESTQEIGAILDVITDVADETNLLALNAAIIAAQAGDSGRGFSVVADQIKELADRTLASTKEIGELIAKVQAESARAMKAIEQGTSSVASGVELSAQAGTSLEEITRAARESGACTTQIVSAVREQTKAAAHVAQLMSQVLAGVEQIRGAEAERTRGSDVILRSAATMRDVAQQVRATTQEQARGSTRIRDTTEGVRETTERINEALQQQSQACGEVARFLERVQGRTGANDAAAERMGEAVASLARQAEALREGTKRFRL